MTVAEMRDRMSAGEFERHKLLATVYANEQDHAKKARANGVGARR